MTPSEEFFFDDLSSSDDLDIDDLLNDDDTEYAIIDPPRRETTREYSVIRVWCLFSNGPVKQIFRGPFSRSRV